jgi:oligoribonuclease
MDMPKTTKINSAAETVKDATPAAGLETIVHLAKNDQNLIWLDCEMTGLDPDKERLIEIAVVITGPNLTPRIEGPVLVIHQSDTLLNNMDNWNKGTHGKSGLIDKVKASTLSEAEAEAEILAFLKKYVPKATSPLCGNTSAPSRNWPSAGVQKSTNHSKNSKNTRPWPMCMSQLMSWNTIESIF